MKIINQPKDAKFLNVISSVLTANVDCEDHIFFFLVAYVRKSGVLRIKDAVNYFKSKGGRVVAIAGVDQTTTTYQGLKELRDLADELFVYHSQGLGQTFHPKVYIHQISGLKADVFVGSSNLTAGGLFANYEVNCHISYNLRNELDIEEYRYIERLIEFYSDISSPCCLSVDDNVLAKLLENGYLGNESVRPGGGRASGDEREPLFGTDTFEPPPTVIIPTDAIEEDSTLPRVTELREGFWKKLSNNDVSTTSSPGQMIIPIRYILFFPEFTDKQAMPSGGQQADVYFNIYFRNIMDHTSLIKNVRSIHYIPAPSHPRPNQELRFTFLNREILESLSPDDILIFRRTDNPDIWFEVVHLESTTTEFNGIDFSYSRYGTIDT